MASTTPTSGMESTASTIAENLKTGEAINRARQGAHDIVDRVADKAGPAFDRLRSGVSSATASMQSGAENLNEMQKQWLDTCRGAVRDHPLAALGIALAAGILISRITMER